MAVATSRVIIGPMVTPLARRRPHQLARETVTLDRLSGGRLVLGVGLGSERTGEFDPARFGEEGSPRERARLLDDGLSKLVAYWDGEFEPRPVVADPDLGRGALAEPPPAAARRALRRRVPDRPPRAGRARRLHRRRSDVADVVVTTKPGERPGAVGRGRRDLVPDRLRPDRRPRPRSRAAIDAL